MNEDQTPKDEGSVWASYSDLFTNVAIIFLVMFVFALLKSGVSKMETALVKKQHQDELKGKLTEKEVEISKQKIKKVEDSIKDMQKVGTLVDDKIKEIQQFAKSMEQNKTILNELIEEQKKKDSLLNTVNQTIVKKEEMIKSLQDETKTLDEKIKNIEAKKIALEEAVKKSELKSEKELAKIDKLEQELKLQAKSKNDKEAEIKSLTHLVSSGQVTIESLEKQNHELSEKINSTQVTAKNLQQSKSLLEQRISEFSSSKTRMEKTISQLEQKVSEQSLQGESLLQKLGKAENEQSKMRETIGKLNQNIDNKISEINHLNGLHQKSLAEAGKLQSQLKDTQDKMRNLGQALMDMKGKLRSSVADSLKRKFGAQNLNVMVDNNTGNITLLMNDNFLFKKNSHELSEKAQTALGKIAPIYSEVIFGDQNLRNKIENIEITGHASPSFKKSYVDPKTDHPEAYGHNMRLSAQRAASIANYMVGKAIGKYEFKSEMRESIYAIGRSYVSPIEKPKVISRGLASVQVSEDTCGPYDCELSQRVEIGFRLKDDMKAIEKLINMAGAK
jgi:outer membrane protein OmpA-like peptidoglycan-associated protein